MFPVKIDRPSCSLPNADNWVMWHSPPQPPHTHTPHTHRQRPTFSVRTNPLEAFEMDAKIEGSQNVLLKDSEMHANLIAQDSTVGLWKQAFCVGAPCWMWVRIVSEIKNSLNLFSWVHAHLLLKWQIQPPSRMHFFHDKHAKQSVS